MKVNKMKSVLFVMSVMYSSASMAMTPECLDERLNVLPINNSRVIQLKANTPNEYLTRAHVKGIIGKVYQNTTGHARFEVIIGSRPTDTIEFVYNEDFGELPELKAGFIAEACGDYITSNKQAKYPPSPNGAIIHWIHKSNGRHLSGFIMINNKLYGQGN